MKTFKRLDENTVIVEGVYYTTNQAKKQEIFSPQTGNKIEYARLNLVYYYPYKLEK